MPGVFANKRVPHVLFGGSVVLLCTVIFFGLWDNDVMQDTYVCWFLPYPLELLFVSIRVQDLLFGSFLVLICAVIFSIWENDVSLMDMFVALSLKTNIPGRNGALARSMHQPDACLLSEKRWKNVCKRIGQSGLLYDLYRHRNNYRLISSWNLYTVSITTRLLPIRGKSTYLFAA